MRDDELLARLADSCHAHIEFAQEIQSNQQQTDTPQMKDTVETYAALPKELLSGMHHPPPEELSTFSW